MKTDKRSAKAPPKPEVRHTLGPWEVTGATRVVKFGEDHAAIAIVCDPGYGETTGNMREAGIGCPTARFRVACANAQLISAAPDMLVVLIEAAKELRWQRFVECARLGLDYHEFIKREWGGVDPKMKAIDEAIAKATGITPSATHPPDPRGHK